MQFFIKLLIFESIKNNPEITKLTQAFIDHLKILFSKGKVILSGAFKDAKGGFIIIDVENIEAPESFTGSTVLNNMYIEAHPFRSFDRLSDFVSSMVKKKSRHRGDRAGI